MPHARTNRRKIERRSIPRSEKLADPLLRKRAQAHPKRAPGRHQAAYVPGTAYRLRFSLLVRSQPDTNAALEPESADLSERCRRAQCRPALELPGDDNYPLWPGEPVYGCYTSEESA